MSKKAAPAKAAAEQPKKADAAAVAAKPAKPAKPKPAPVASALESPKVLAAMSERAFAEYYSKMMRLAKPLVKIKGGDARKPYIDRLLAEMKKPESERQQPPAPEQQEAEEQAVAAEAAAATKPAKKEKKEKSPVEKKRARRQPPEKIEPSSVDNPFRTGTAKYDGFNVYKKGGTWAGVREKITALGVKEATAENWMTYTFARVAEGGPAQVNRRKEAKAAAAAAAASTEVPGAAVPAK